MIGVRRGKKQRSRRDREERDGRSRKEEEEGGQEDSWRWKKLAL